MDFPGCQIIGFDFSRDGRLAVLRGAVKHEIVRIINPGLTRETRHHSPNTSIKVAEGIKGRRLESIRNFSHSFETLLDEHIEKSKQSKKSRSQNEVQ